MWAVPTGVMWLKVLVPFSTRQVPGADGGRCPLAAPPSLSVPVAPFRALVCIAE